MALMQKGHHAPVWVTGSVLSKSSKGNGQVVVSFRNEAGESIDAYLACTEAAWQYTEQKLKALGWDPAENDFDLRPLNAGAASPIVGNETGIEVIEDSYVTESGETKKTPKVGWIGSRTGAAGLPESEMDVFAAELRKRLIAAKGAPKPSARPAAKPAPRSSSVPW